MAIGRFNHQEGQIISIFLSSCWIFVNFDVDYCFIFTIRIIIVFYFLELNICLNSGVFVSRKRLPNKWLRVRDFHVCGFYHY